MKYNERSCITCNIPYTKGIHHIAGCKICKTNKFENWKKKHKIYINLFFRWYDLWIGLYIDKPNRTLYICPLPMIGLKIRYIP